MAAEYIGLSSTPPHSLAAQRVKYRRLIIWTIRDRRPFRQRTPHTATGRDPQTEHAVQAPPGSGRSQVPATVLVLPIPSQARAKGTSGRTDRSNRRDEIQKPEFRPSADCPAD